MTYLVRLPNAVRNVTAPGTVTPTDDIVIITAAGTYTLGQVPAFHVIEVRNASIGIVALAVTGLPAINLAPGDGQQFRGNGDGTANLAGALLGTAPGIGDLPALPPTADMLIPVCSADGTMTGRVTAAQLVAAVNPQPSGGTSPPPPSPNPTPAPNYTFAFLGGTLSQPNAIVQFNVSSADGATRYTPTVLPIVGWTLSTGFSTSTTVPPRPGSRAYSTAAWNSYQAGNWETNVGGYPLSSAPGTYYPWVITSDGATHCFDTHPFTFT